MKIKELMTEEAIVADPETPLKDVAAILARHRISGLPIVDSQRKVIGVVSEADIVAKEQGSEPRHGGVLRWLLDGGALGDGRLTARTAGDAMTVPPITIGVNKSASEGARLMTEKGIKRLPVVDPDGTLLGIVTRADLVQAFARADAEIEHEILEEVVKQTLWIEPSALEVDVAEGEVTLSGEVDRKSDAELLEHFVARVPGVVSVSSSVRWKWDDAKKLDPNDPRVAIGR